MKDSSQLPAREEIEPVTTGDYSYVGNRFLEVARCTATVYFMSMMVSIGSPPGGADQPGFSERFQTDDSVPPARVQQAEFIK